VGGGTQVSQPIQGPGIIASSANACCRSITALWISLMCFAGDILMRTTAPVWRSKSRAIIADAAPVIRRISNLP